MTNQIKHMNLLTHKQRIIAYRNRFETESRKSTGVYVFVLNHETSPSILMQRQITSICSD